MNTSLLIEQLKDVSKDLRRAIRSGESLEDRDRMQLEHAIVLLQLSSWNPNILVTRILGADTLTVDSPIKGIALPPNPQRTLSERRPAHVVIAQRDPRLLALV